MHLLQKNLSLDRCPHCSIARPHLNAVHSVTTNDHSGALQRKWFFYVCVSCGGVVTAWAYGHSEPVQEYFPALSQVDEAIPDKPREFLRQAKESMHAPAGAIMLAASAVDAMLKLKRYVDGSLYTRIEKAAADHLITQAMAKWAHQVRIDANDQRHADEASELPNEDDAKRVIAFTTALAEFLFVLPALVSRGLEETKKA